ncbi:hypothetical protein VPH35_050625 [Triticum aestivum]
MGRMDARGPRRVFDGPGVSEAYVVVVRSPAKPLVCLGPGRHVAVQRRPRPDHARDAVCPLFPVSFSVAASCGAVGVAGLARSARSFLAQVASAQRVASSFALCLPGDGDRAGAAIFSGGPFFLAPRADRPAVTTLLSEGVPLRRPFAGDPGYYVSASNGIAMDGACVAFASAGAPIVGFSTVHYTELRHDVYRPLIAAFDRAMGRSARRVTPAVAPFELCYDSTKLLSAIVADGALSARAATPWRTLASTEAEDVVWADAEDDLGPPPPAPWSETCSRSRPGTAAASRATRSARSRRARRSGSRANCSMVTMVTGAKPTDGGTLWQQWLASPARRNVAVAMRGCNSGDDFAPPG